MRVVVDTNVFVSGVFFGGIPGRILDMWRDGDIDLLLTPQILAEYGDIVHRLHARYPGVDPEPIVSLVIRRGVFVADEAFAQPVSVDQDDDKFLAAAVAGRSNIVVSGDRHLLQVSGHAGIDVLTPAQFIEKQGSEHEDGRGR